MTANDGISQLDPWEQTSVKSEPKYRIYMYRKYISKCHLKFCDHFDWGEVCVKGSTEGRSRGIGVAYVTCSQMEAGYFNNVIKVPCITVMNLKSYAGQEGVFNQTVIFILIFALAEHAARLYMYIDSLFVTICIIWLRPISLSLGTIIHLFNVFQLYTHLTSRATVNGNNKMEDLLPCIWSWHFNCFSSRCSIFEVSQAPTWVVRSSWYIVVKGVEYEGAGILTVDARNNTITIYNRIIAWLKMYAALTVLSPCIYNIYVNTRIFVVDIRIRLQRCDDVASFPATGSTHILKAALSLATRLATATYRNSVLSVVFHIMLIID